MEHDLKGILFDLGDTLLNFGRVDVPSLFEAGARLAYDYLQSLGQPLPPFPSYHRRQYWAIRWNIVRSHLRRREFNSLNLIARLSRRMGHSLTRDQLVELAWLWYKPLSDCADVEEGTADVLEGLRDGGYSLGVVSNTFVPGQVLDRHLEAVGLLEYLPIRVYSCDVRYRKPNPRIFRLALERVGISPREAMFVGDSPRADVYGANRAGMISVLKDPTGQHDHSSHKPNYAIRRLIDLPGLVERARQ